MSEWDGFDDYLKTSKLEKRHKEVKGFLNAKTSAARDAIIPEYGAGEEALALLRGTLTRTVYSPIGQLFSTEARLDDFCNFAANNSDSIVCDVLFLTESLKRGEDPELLKGIIDDHRGFVSSSMLIFSKDGPELYAKYNPNYQEDPEISNLYQEVVDFNNTHAAIQVKPAAVTQNSTTGQNQ